MFHDHTERAFTTDGMGEGGSISLVAYRDYLDDKGTPKTHGMDLTPYFTKKYWERKLPVWQNLADDWGSLGSPAISNKPQPTSAPVSDKTATSAGNGATTTEETGGFGSLLFGFLLGSSGYFGFLNRTSLSAWLRRVFNRDQSRS
jgi:hypothetical protein